MPDLDNTRSVPDRPSMRRLREGVGAHQAAAYIEHVEERLESLTKAVGEQTEKNRKLLNRVTNITRSRQRWQQKARDLGYIGPGPNDPTGIDPPG